ncbi:glycosyltransferase, partial [bacterium]|nr:glycosyltransferase [bacterium]
VLGLVNLEALACGTPVITFDTGGSPECLDNNCGIVVPCDDIEALKDGIEWICSRHPFSVSSCVNRAKVFNMDERLAEYVKLFNQM